MSRSLVTIIIPVYNAERFIADCLKSVLSQVYKNLEIIIVNDGSTDGSREIIDKAVVGDSRVSVFDIKNSGVCAARNISLDHSHGDYVMFVDADDFLLPDSVETLMRGFENSKCSLSMGTYLIQDESGDMIFKEKHSFELDIHGGECVNLMFRKQRFHYQGYLWNKIYRLDVIKKYNILFAPSLKFNEDRLFNVEYMLKMPGELHFTSKPVYIYVLHPDSVMGNIRKRFDSNLLSDYEASVLMFGLLKDSPNTTVTTLNLARDRIFESCDTVRSNAKLSESLINTDRAKQLYDEAISIVGGRRYYLDNRVRRFISIQINSLRKKLGLSCDYMMESMLF